MIGRSFGSGWWFSGMDRQVVTCGCCGLEEECTAEYIRCVKSYFGGRWLCGLCSEAVKYEISKCGGADVERAVCEHMAFCRMLKRDGGPAVGVVEGMCHMLHSASRAGRHRPSPRAIRL